MKLSQIREILWPYIAMVLIVAPLVGVGWYAMVHYVPGTYQMYEAMPPQPAALSFSILVWSDLYAKPYVGIILLVALLGFEIFVNFKVKPTARKVIAFLLTLANVLIISFVLCALFAVGSSKFILRKAKLHVEQRDQKGEQPPAGDVLKAAPEE